MRGLGRPEIDALLTRARHLANEDATLSLAGRVVGLFFYDDSLRTRVGFEVATIRLGGHAFSTLGARHTAVMSQPESVHDAVRSVASWCDAICLRHPDVEAASEVARLVECPVINCGNGGDEHPTQSLIDLMAIQETSGGIDGVRIALVGDLDGMRVAHSLMMALGNYRGVHVRCISPPGLGMPRQYTEHFLTRENTIEHLDRVELADIDVVYVAGLPRHTRVPVSDTTRTAFWITGDTVRTLGPTVRVLCPLPRIDEIQPEVDATPNAVYFQQSSLGLPVRMAILEHVVGVGPG
jgi:aspartate carbamoyltransferase catalytic subunit